MTRPTHSTPDGHAYIELQKLAKAQGRKTDELLQLYVLERFLARLATSYFADQFVLKGGVLLAAFASRRPTMDIDFAARNISNDLNYLKSVIAAVVSAPKDDGVEYDATSITTEVIRDDDLYSGARVSISTKLSKARVRFHIDVNFGDPIEPAPSTVEVPALLGGSLSVVGYPLEMILAEKIVTAIDRGATSTRWRDFADIWSLVQRHDVDGTRLTDAIQTVAQHREIPLALLSTTLDGYADFGQSRWNNWRLKIRLHESLPESFDEVLRLVYAFADPVLSGDAEPLIWKPDIRQWQ